LVLASAAGGQQLPEAPDACECEGAALFADIAGYTRLTRNLARYGPRGAELVGDLLNACFSPAIGEISAHGGDVLGFAGDAIIAFWHGESCGEVAAVAHACAAAIQQRTFVAPSFLRGESLQMRIGVGAGRTWLMRLGGHEGAWIFVAAGEPFTQMGVAARAAGLGAVMLSPQARAASADCLPGFSPRALVDDGALDVDALKAFLPEVVLQRVAAGQSEWLAELRTICVVFCTMPRMELGDRGQRERLQAFVQHAQRTAARLSGTTFQVAVDDKGCVVILAFGLPPLGHDDDAYRAIRAALELDDALDGLDIAHGVGVATGPAYCGGCGSLDRRGYMVIGDAVNRAARLSQRGEADVLCDQHTRDAIGDRLRLDDDSVSDGPAGKGGPRAFRARRSQPASWPGAGVTFRPPAFYVGRRQEIQLLRDRLRDFQHRALPGSLVTVEGRAGAGKTSLVATAIDSLAARDVTVIGGAAAAVETSTSYRGWRTVIQDLLGLVGAADDAARERAVREGVVAAMGSDAWAPLLNGILPVALSENATTQQMSGQVRGQSTLRLLVRLLDHASARTPLILVLDDVQWFDATSLELVSAVQRARIPVLQVLIVRTEGDQSPGLAALQELASDPDTLRLELGEMSRDDLRLLLAHSLAVDFVPEDVLSIVAGRAEGNPFFARELGYAMRDAGELIVEGSRCWLGAAGARRPERSLLPETVKSVVMQRLDQLSPGQLMTLKVGSVLGSRFDEAALEAVYPLEEDRRNIRSHLEQLSALQFARSLAGATGWEFAHSIIRDATYELIPQSQLRLLHRAAALYLEKSENHALLAHHWNVTGERDKWLVCVERAGDEAMARGANHEAVSFFEQVLKRDDLAGADNLRRAHWHGQVGEAWYLLGTLGKSRYHLEEALRLLGEPLPRTAAGWAVRALREIAAQGILLVASRRLPRSSVDNQRRLREASRLMSILSEQFYFAVDIRRMVVSLLSTINLAERTETPETASRAYGTLGYVVGLSRLHGLSRLYFHRGRRGLDAGAHVNAAVGDALYHLAFGRWSACLAALEQGRTHAEAVGDTFGVGLCLNVLGDARHLMGALPEATAAYADLVANARARSNSQHEVWGLSGCAETLLSQGRIDEAQHRLLECAKVMPLIADRDRLSAFRHEGVKAAILLRLEDAAGAAAALDEALRLHRADPTPMYATYWAVVSILETSLALWRRQGSTGHLPMAVRDTSRLMRRFAMLFPIARSRNALLLGHRRWLAGDQAAAMRRWRQAEAIGTRLEMRHEIALAKEALACPSRVGAMIGAETEPSPFDRQITW
jgi:class 3 adenylate cyclase/tetratricopeptide (TPR) repeat protein